ncbi:hypothetical protein QJS10_CPA16g00992 [Acorus calamus]|uniref:Uncharacterized protein n=1 Tax=Acorus calamus TaxID=4465 RepID=A0AAV9D2H0_ACOCL|nr:hypothetical protein QJS10_CPA16g00992 [Acorus calamus]
MFGRVGEVCYLAVQKSDLLLNELIGGEIGPDLEIKEHGEEEGVAEVIRLIEEIFILDNIGFNKFVRGQVREVSEMLIDASEASIPMSEEVLEAFVADFHRRRDQFESDCLDFTAFGPEDLDAFLKKEAEELNLVDAEAMELSNEIEALKRTVVQDSAMLMKELEELDDLLKSIDAGASTDLQFSICNDGSISVKNEDSMIDKSEGNPKIWQADQCSEEAGIILSSLRELDYHLKREEAISQIEDILSHVKVIEYKEGLWFRGKLDGIIWPLSIDHELLIEVVDGKTEMINVEIFPNDVSISTVVDAVKSSRHSFEYSDRDEIITAHLKGGIKVLIKVCQGWPVSTSPLKLVSVKNSDIYAKDISLSCLSKLELARISPLYGGQGIKPK